MRVLTDNEIRQVAGGAPIFGGVAGSAPSIVQVYKFGYGIGEAFNLAFEKANGQSLGGWIYDRTH